MEKYAIINYDSLYDSVDVDLIETDIKQGTEDWEILIESYETNHGTIIVASGEKFLKEIKDLKDFRKVTKEDLN